MTEAGISFLYLFATENDNAEIRQLYRPFILSEPFIADNWVGLLELSRALQTVENKKFGRNQNHLRIPLRQGDDVRVGNPANLPEENDEQHSHPEAQELSTWSNGHVLLSPKQHGNLVSPLLALIAGDKFLMRWHTG
jgi:arsenical resistance protein ArsH